MTEHVDTPSGPRGRRARWHETLSQFDLEIKYIPGPENVIPDAMSRWAYPASSAREDVSFHGSLEAREEVKQMLREELVRAKLVGMVRLKSPTQARFLVGGGLYPADLVPVKVQVVTRSQLDTDPSGQEDSESDREGASSDDGTPPCGTEWGGEEVGEVDAASKGDPRPYTPSPIVPAGC